MKCIKRSALLILAIVALLISGCATPLGQQYGILGGAAGALSGFAVGGTKGAIVGGAAGAAGGGLIGDEIYRQQNQPDRHHHHEHGNQSLPPGGYVQPCRQVREPVYNSYGYVVGYRTVCR